MNCTADLWSGCGLDDAITPELTATSIDAQVGALRGGLPGRFVLGGLSLGGDRRDGPGHPRARAGRGADPRLDQCEGADGCSAPGLERLARPAGRRRDRPRAAEQHPVGAADPVLLCDPARPRRAHARHGRCDRGGGAAEPARDAGHAGRPAARAARGHGADAGGVGGRRSDLPAGVPRGAVEAIPGAQLETLDAGHLLPMEKPAEFGALVRRWVAEHVESGAAVDRRTRCGARPRIPVGVAAEPADDLRERIRSCR